jgi:hypothetical protein
MVLEPGGSGGHSVPRRQMASRNGPLGSGHRLKQFCPAAVGRWPPGRALVPDDPIGTRRDAPQSQGKREPPNCVFKGRDWLMAVVAQISMFCHGEPPAGSER